MPLEAATYIGQLDAANPSPTDLVAQGDDHIRLIKAVLKATFPNLDGAVTLTDEDLNSLSATVGSKGVPFGVITMWYGTAAAVPAGWAICDGGLHAKSDGSGDVTTPDLRDKVVIGVGSLQPTAGGAYGAATSGGVTGAGGAHSHAIGGGGGHTHTGVTVAGHALTISEMPSHDHTIGGNPGDGGGSLMQTSGGSPTTIHVAATGGSQPHTHGITWPATPDGTHTHTSDTAPTHTHSVNTSTYQPSVALHYIMKV